jgi:hypothetical protein
MTAIVPLESLRRAPARDVVLRTQGVPAGGQVPERVDDLVREAIELYEALAEPRGLVAGISVPDFHDVYEGEGGNAVPSPLPGIVETAEHLALFSATLGEPISRKINDLFRGNDAPLGCMLDGVASERADTASNILGRLFLESLLEDREVNSGAKVLPYSPGYCGWHVSGQRKLFAYLDPGQIGITLSASCLMSPIKSVSGVLIVGPAESHAFDNDFDFCLDCATWQCRERIASTTHGHATTR